MGVSFIETEPSGIRLVPADQARDDFDTALIPTPIPWYSRQDDGGNWQKVPALAPGFCYEDFPYGRPAIPYEQWGQGYDRRGNPVYCEVQPGYVTSFPSGLIVTDLDVPGAAWEMLKSIGACQVRTAEVSTGRPDGRHLYWDGRHLTREQWPRQRNYVGLFDIKSSGFIAAPGSVHHSGRRYELITAMSPALWDPEWTPALDELFRSLGGAPGSSHERGEGSGRNNELLSYKAYLYFVMGIEQDDPVMRHLVLAYNDSFTTPLSLSEVETTVLRHKRFDRDSTRGAEDQLDDGERQEHEARMAEAFGQAADARDVSAGQEVFLLLERDESAEGVEKSSDLGEYAPEPTAAPGLVMLPPRTVKQCLAKYRAECDPHPKSARDWGTAPEGTRDQCYRAMIDAGIRAIEAGAPLAQFSTRGCPSFQLSGPWREQIEWLLHGDGVPLIEMAGGVIKLLGDPRSEPKTPYPGVPEGVNPKAGKSMGPKLDDLINIVRSCKDGDSLTQRGIATIINHASFREALGLGEYRYVSVGSISKHHVGMRKNGSLRITEKAVRYREKRQWRLELPARYKTNLRLPDAHELARIVAATRLMIREEQAAARQKRLELAA